jgi:hypothetical protein
LTPRGELKGETRLLERFRMSFEVAAPMRPGDAADFRLSLPHAGDGGGPGEVNGTVRVLRIVDAHPDAPTLFSAEILSVRKDDLPTLEAWLAQYATNGRRRFEAISGSESPEVELSETGLTDIYDSVDLPGQTVTQTSSSAPYGFSSSAPQQDLRLAGREAIRSALRRGLEAKSRPGRIGGRSRRWMEHTRRRAEAQVKHWLEGRNGAPKEEGPEPRVEICSTVTPITVTVRWFSADAYRRDWRQHLQRGGLFVPSAETLPRNRSLQLRLELPSGEAIACQAQVVAPMPTGAGLSLRLTSDQKARLEAESA